MSQEHYQQGQRFFKFKFELRPGDTPQQQKAKMKIAFERAVENFFDWRKPFEVDRSNEPQPL
jgi:hypothetical protein